MGSKDNFLAIFGPILSLCSGEGKEWSDFFYTFKSLQLMGIVKNKKVDKDILNHNPPPKENTYFTFSKPFYSLTDPP